ncbi:MAG: Hsp70 family protein [Bacteroidales bacterium]|nr:Hsp70 family protein [Bacteroidales bacterium]
MARYKIDYGIDLGTTNSAICRMEKGAPVIKKIEVTDDTMPSCVFFNRKQGIVVGSSAYRSMKSDKKRATHPWEAEASNAFVEFKRTMGTDKKYFSSHMGRDYSSEELSAEVLKTLKSFITDDEIKSVVITVPAKFTVNQKTATLEAAKLAGFEHCELLQEPIAASMAYGLSSNEKDGFWMVFDFGGGTFDAALLKVEDGIMQVFATEGDNYLGGKNLDYAIVDEAIIPYLEENFTLVDIMADSSKKTLLRDAMKTYAEDVRNQLSFKQKEDIISNLGDLGEDDLGEELELDLTITQEHAFSIMRPYYQKAVDICKRLLDKNNMIGEQLNKLILVGGPTNCPLIKQMLKEQITPNVDDSIDPMTAVATGAALYASTLDAEVKLDDVKKEKEVIFDLTFESMSVAASEWVSIKIKSGAEKVNVEFVRADNAWASGKVEVDTMGNVVELNFIEGRSNAFVINTYDQFGNKLPCFPNEITIIQGSKVGSATLPYNIGIAKWNDEKRKAVFQQARGLEKDKTLPAIGVINDLKTNNELRAGISADVIKIPIYQAESDSQGKSAVYQEYVADVTVSGDDVDESIPENSNVDVTIKVDSSERMTIKVYFPGQDVTVEKELDTSKKQSTEEAKEYVKTEIAKAEQRMRGLGNNDTVQLLKTKLADQKKNIENSSEPKEALQHLKEVLREIEDYEDGSAWDRMEAKLKSMASELQEDQKKYGDSETKAIVDNLVATANDAILKKDVRFGQDIYDQMRQFDYKLALIEYFISWIYNWDKRYNIISWKDSARAKSLINQGLEMINNAPTAEKLRPVVDALIKLIPESELPPMPGGLLS